MGEMNMHGVTKVVEVDMEFVGQQILAEVTVGFETSFTVKRSDFGMNWGWKGSLGDTNQDHCQP